MKKKRYVGDSMLMQAFEPILVPHNKHKQTNLAQTSVEADRPKKKYHYSEMDTGVIILLGILLLIVIIALIFCCCYCCAASKQAKEEKQQKQEMDNDMMMADEMMMEPAME